MSEANHGLNLVLTVVVFLFMIGLIIFIFSMFGGAIISTTSTDGSGAINESIIFNETGYATSVASVDGVALSNTHVYKCNPTCSEIPSSNYTLREE
jgi:hypothetical protein